MAIVNGTASRVHARGNLKEQLVDFTIATGQTSGTIVAPSIANLLMVIVGTKVVYTAAPTYSGNTATLAFTVATGGTAGTALCIGR